MSKPNAGQLGQAPAGFWPKSGDWQCGDTIVAFTNGGPAIGTSTYARLKTDDKPRPISALGVQCSTALNGGTVTIRVAIYGDDGTGTGPDLATGPLAVVTLAEALTTFTIGKKTGTVSFTFAANRTYWLGFLYYAPAAPTQAPQFVTVSNSGPQMPLPDSSAFGVQGRGTSVVSGASQSTFPTSGTPLVVTGNTVVVVYFRAA